MSSRHTRTRPVVPARRRAPALAAAALAVAAAAACGGRDPYAPIAQTSTVGPQSLTLVPLSRVRAPFYPALDLRFAEPVQPAVGVTGNGLVPNFDVAFDVDGAGRIILLPAKLVVSTTVVPSTGFQTSSTKFDSLGSAPGGTYQSDSVRVTVGQTVVVQAQSTICGAGSFFYAKLVVDSVYSTTGALAVRVLSDPNCGFKSFASGVPTS
jgi:hypothetical protein